MQDEFLAARCNILSGTRLTFFARHPKTDVAFAPMIHGSVETYSERKLTNIGYTHFPLKHDYGRNGVI